MSVDLQVSNGHMSGAFTYAGKIHTEKQVEKNDNETDM